MNVRARAWGHARLPLPPRRGRREQSYHSLRLATAAPLSTLGDHCSPGGAQCVSCLQFSAACPPQGPEVGACPPSPRPPGLQSAWAHRRPLPGLPSQELPPCRPGKRVQLESPWRCHSRFNPVAGGPPRGPWEEDAVDAGGGPELVCATAASSLGTLKRQTLRPRVPNLCPLLCWPDPDRLGPLWPCPGFRLLWFVCASEGIRQTSGCGRIRALRGPSGLSTTNQRRLFHQEHGGGTCWSCPGAWCHR